MLFEFIIRNIYLYVKARIRTLSDKFYASFRGLNAPEGGEECKCFTIISIDSLLL